MVYKKWFLNLLAKLSKKNEEKECLSRNYGKISVIT